VTRVETVFISCTKAFHSFDATKWAGLKNSADGRTRSFRLSAPLAEAGKGATEIAQEIKVPRDGGDVDPLD
jgi:hypothetical protein